MGLESSPDCLGWATGQRCGVCYIDRMTEVFREVRRVLQDNGVCFIVIGDSYCANRGNTTKKPGYDNKAAGQGANLAIVSFRKDVNGLKPKDLCGIPWRLALSLQADGWYLRSEITWCKKSAMPESVRDRPSMATEKIFLFTKSANYYYDAEAVKIPAKYPRSDNKERKPSHQPGGKGVDTGVPWEGSMANLRNFWLLGPEPLREPHYAAFPTEIPRRCILAGTSQAGSCPQCNAPWTRTIERQPNPQGINGGEHREVERQGALAKRDRDYQAEKRIGVATTTGWRPSCRCPGLDGNRPGSDGTELDNWPRVPCVVLDPFMGSGTVVLVAERLGRNSLGIELNGDYVKMARRRIEGDAPLFYQEKEKVRVESPKHQESPQSQEEGTSTEGEGQDREDLFG